MALFLFVFSFCPALAKDYTLEWDANEEPARALNPIFKKLIIIKGGLLLG
jgi:hypothetical protein